MRTERVYLDGIETLERLRPLHPDRVSAIKSSIEEIGLRTPLTVMAKPDGEDTRMILVAGHHRLEALRQIGEEATECFVIDDDEIDAKLWEIAENLCRAGLSKEERDEHIRRYAELLEARRQSTQNASIESKRDDGKGHRPKGVASRIAEETGVSKDTVRRALNPDRVKSERARAMRRAGELLKQIEPAMLLADRGTKKPRRPEPAGRDPHFCTSFYLPKSFR